MHGIEEEGKSERENQQQVVTAVVERSNEAVANPVSSSAKTYTSPLHPHHRHLRTLRHPALVLQKPS